MNGSMKKILEDKWKWKHSGSKSLGSSKSSKMRIYSDTSLHQKTRKILKTKQNKTNSNLTSKGTRKRKQNNNNNKTQENVMYHSCHYCLKKKLTVSHFSRWYKSLLKIYFNSTHPIFSLSRGVAEETHFPLLPIYKYDLGGGEKGKNYHSILFFLSKCS